MPAPAYIQVILPLRLEWEPCYRVPEGTTVRYATAAPETVPLEKL